MGHPALVQPAAPVADPTVPEIHRLVADMFETMADAPGIGLAAPQVHVPLRIIVFRVPGERGEDADGEDVPHTVLVNPEIEPLGEDMESAIEGCLSLPGMAGMVPRYTRIRYRATTPEGAAPERVAEGYHARVVQHECDHLDGILYPMRMADLSTFGYVEEMHRGMAAGGDDEVGELDVAEA
jgi:peptide deformylase